MKHVNIPVFIPHLGCPNQCVFCNQRSISGALSFSEDHLDVVVGDVLAGMEIEMEREKGENGFGGVVREIAFFGGSFTGIDTEIMIRLLDKAQKYVDRNEISGIRMSTRPDYINDRILRILKKYSVSAVELGLQSFSDEVLKKSKRGHTAAQSYAACRMLRQYGFRFVGQMMIGLPDSRIEDEIFCAETICSLGAAAARIYPAVVFKDTELAEMVENGEYAPLSLEEAVYRTKEVLMVFDKFGVPCIRVGLCDSENLHSEDTYVAGPNHGAIGELAKSELFFEKICGEIDRCGNVNGKNLKVFSPKGAVSQIAGQKKLNKIRIQSKYNIERIKIVENEDLKGYNIKIEIN